MVEVHLITRFMPNLKARAMKETFEALADWIMVGAIVDLESYGFEVQNMVLRATADGCCIDEADIDPIRKVATLAPVVNAEPAQALATWTQ